MQWFIEEILFKNKKSQGQQAMDVIKADIITVINVCIRVHKSRTWILFCSINSTMKNLVVYVAMLSLLSSGQVRSAILSQDGADATLREEVNRYKTIVEQQEIKLNKLEELIDQMQTFFNPLVCMS